MVVGPAFARIPGSEVPVARHRTQQVHVPNLVPPLAIALLASADPNFVHRFKVGIRGGRRGVPVRFAWDWGEKKGLEVRWPTTGCLREQCTTMTPRS